MTMEAPDFFSVTKAVEGRDVIATGTDAAERLRQMAKAGQVKPVAVPDGMRTFLAPTAPNSKYLAVKGKPVTTNVNTGVIGLPAMTHRDGDLWVEFQTGVCTSEDPATILWLEAHSGIPEMHEAYHKHYGDKASECDVPIGLCREQGAGIDVWAELKMGQHPTATRAATISQQIDVDALMRGELTKGARTLSNGMGAIMAAAADANEAAAAERAQGQR